MTSSRSYKPIAFIAVFIAAFIMFGSFAGVTAEAAATVTVRTTHSSGAYLRGFTLKLSADSSVKLYYTADGSKPSASSEPFPSEGLKVKETETVRVLAVKGKAEQRYAYDYTITGTGDLYDHRNKYIYNQLNSKQQAAYDRVVEAVGNREESIDLSDLELTFTEYSDVGRYIFENPQLNLYCYGIPGYAKSDGILTFPIEPSYPEASSITSKKVIKKLEKAAAEIVAGAMELPTTLDKVCYVSQYIISHTSYDDYEERGLDWFGAYDSTTAYGGIMKGKAVCRGYCDTFTYLMQILGIPTQYITVGKGEHAINMVCIDGEWCNVDLTWSPDLTSDYFLISDSTYGKLSEYTKDERVGLPEALTNKYRSKVRAQISGAWATTYSYGSSGVFELDTENVFNGAPFSFRIKNSKYDVSYLARTFNVEPDTEYRFSAMAACSGYSAKGAASGASVGEAFTYNVSPYKKDKGWAKLTYWFTTGKDQKTIDLALYNGMFNADCKGTAWFCSPMLEKNDNGKWVTVSSSLDIGYGWQFVNLGDVQKPLSKLTFSDISDQSYTGKAIKPSVTVKNGSYTLVSGVDYTLSYSSNIKVGTAAVTITGKGIYSGNVTKTFTIAPKLPTVKLRTSGSKLKLSWSSVKGAEKYVIWRSVDGGSFKKVKEVDSDTTSLTGSYNSKHTYMFAVTAYIPETGTYTPYVYTEMI